MNPPEHLIRRVYPPTRIKRASGSTYYLSGRQYTIDYGNHEETLYEYEIDLTTRSYWSTDPLKVWATIDGGIVG